MTHSAPTHTILFRPTHGCLAHKRYPRSARRTKVSGSRKTLTCYGTDQHRQLRDVDLETGRDRLRRATRQTRGSSYATSLNPTPNPPRSLHWNPLPKGRRPDAELDVACLGRFWLGRAAAWGSGSSPIPPDPHPSARARSSSSCHFSSGVRRARALSSSRCRSRCRLFECDPLGGCPGAAVAGTALDDAAPEEAGEEDALPFPLTLIAAGLVRAVANRGAASPPADSSPSLGNPFSTS